LACPFQTVIFEMGTVRVLDNQYLALSHIISECTVKKI
jgi:hypothetical protein